MSHENINTQREKLSREAAEALAYKWEEKAAADASKVKKGLFQSAKRHEELKLEVHRNSVKTQNHTHDWNQAMRDPAWDDEDPADVWKHDSGWR